MQRFGVFFILAAFFGFAYLYVPRAAAAADPGTGRLVYDAYDRSLDFTSRSVVRITRGDEPAFADPRYDDSSWNIIPLPHNWNRLFPGYTGICWYRLHVVFPSQPPSRAVGVFLGEIVDADEVYFNGELIGSTGSIDPRRSDYDRKRIYEIPHRLIRPGEENVLAIRVAGKFYDINGPHMGPFVIGQMQKLQRNLLAKEFFDVLFMAVYITVSIYFLSLFIKQRDELEYLYFSLFSLGTGTYLFLRTQVKYFITENFLVLKRIEYVLVYLIFIFFMEFLTHHFEKKHTALHYIYPALGFVFLPVILISDDIMLWHKVLNYVIQPAWVIPVGYYLWVLINEFRRDSDAKYILGSLFILLITMLNDVAVHRGVYHFVRVSNYGFLFLVIGVGAIMRNRYVKLSLAFEEVKQKESRKSQPELTSFSKSKAEEAIAYLRENVRSEVTREDIAAELGLHPDHLGKMFKRYTGRTINDYLNGLRAREAARMIAETDMGITHIAYAIGFESLATFYRVFQKEIGEQPKAYRERIKGAKPEQDG